MTTPTPIEVLLTEAVVVLPGGGGGGAVESVNGRTGAVVLTKADVALTNVDNTSDAAKPISTAMGTALAAKADLVGGVVPTAQLPPLAINDVFTVASQAAMLALTAQRGDVAIRTDVSRAFILSVDAPSVLANWKELLTPADAVTSVAGKTGVVALVKGDVGLGSVDNTSDASKPVSTAQQTALDGKANTSHTQASSSILKVSASPVVVGGTGASGAPLGEIPYAIVATGDTIAYRDTDGTLKVATPVDPDDAVTKAYADGIGGGGGVPWTRPKTAGDYLHAATSAAATAGASAFAVGATNFIPIYVGAAFSADALTIKVGTAESGISAALLLYSSDADGHPVTLVASGTIATTTAGVYTATFTPVNLPAGLYWATVRTDGGSTIRFDSVAGTSLRTLVSGASSAFETARTPLVKADPGTFASPTATLVSWTYSSTESVPWIAIRRSA